MKDDNHQHGHGKHMIMMLIGCLLPIAIILGVKFFNVGGNGLAKYSSLLFLLCPLMHILMMGGMMGHGKKSCCQDEDLEDNKNINE